MSTEIDDGLRERGTKFGHRNPRERERERNRKLRGIFGCVCKARGEVTRTGKRTNSTRSAHEPLTDPPDVSEHRSVTIRSERCESARTTVWSHHLRRVNRCSESGSRRCGKSDTFRGAVLPYGTGRQCRRDCGDALQALGQPFSRGA